MAVSSFDHQQQLEQWTQYFNNVELAQHGAATGTDSAGTGSGASAKGAKSIKPPVDAFVSASGGSAVVSLSSISTDLLGDLSGPSSGISGSSLSDIIASLQGDGVGTLSADGQTHTQSELSAAEAQVQTDAESKDLSLPSTDPKYQEALKKLDADMAKLSQIAADLGPSTQSQVGVDLLNNLEGDTRISEGAGIAAILAAAKNGISFGDMGQGASLAAEAAAVHIAGVKAAQFAATSAKPPVETTGTAQNGGQRFDGSQAGNTNSSTHPGTAATPSAGTIGAALPAEDTWKDLSWMESKYSYLAKYHDAIAAASKATGVPENLIAADIVQESGGDPNAASHNPDSSQPDDLGLMQVSNGSFDPATNIMQGAKVLEDNYNQVKGDITSKRPDMVGNAAFTWGAALRLFNSGTVNYENLNDGGIATGSYVSDMMGRLGGNGN